jgi:SprT protein
LEEARQKLYKIFQRHVPDNAVHYCLDLWSALPFHFKVTRRRQTKLGDYRYNPVNKLHAITVNHDLNKYSFLITYIHELAHLLTTERNGRKAVPHGASWQANFKELMEPVMTDLIFPADVLIPLKNHMRKPKASTYADAKLLHALRKYDESTTDLVPLAQLDEGDIFEFNNLMYKKIHLRRTRVLCQQSGTSRKFLISKMALVRCLRTK